MLTGQVAVVIGGSGGLGSRIALSLGEVEAMVAVVYRKNSQGAMAVADYISSCMVESVDITNEIEVSNLMSKVAQTFGSIDILINCAGIYHAKYTKGTELSAWNEVINTNLTGTFLCCKHALPYMLNRKYGRIINISSFCGRDGLPGTSAYSASKAGITSLTKVIGAEVANRGITANVVSPGVFNTGMVKHFSEGVVDALRDRIPSQRLGQPNDLASLVCFLASKEAGYINRQVIGIDGGI